MITVLKVGVDIVEVNKENGPVILSDPNSHKGHFYDLRSNAFFFDNPDDFYKSL